MESSFRLAETGCPTKRDSKTVQGVREATLGGSDGGAREIAAGRLFVTGVPGGQVAGPCLRC